MSRHHYQACGLSIVADAPVPGLAHAFPSSSPDLRVSFDAGSGWPNDDRGPWATRYQSPGAQTVGEPQLIVRVNARGDCWFRYCDGAEFLIDGDGRHIAARWGDTLTPADVAVYLLGPVLGFVMRLRGLIPLHASAVAVRGKARLFVGEAGAGKSTTAAACATLGYPVLSDDIVPVVVAAGSLVAYPAHPRVTMWPDSAEGLFGADDRLPALTPTYDKRYLALEPGRSFQQSPLAVEVIYVLGERTAESGVEVQALPRRDAFMTLVSNTYVSYLIDRPMRAREFGLLGLVAEQIPVGRLRLGSAMTELPSACARLMTTAGGDEFRWR